jgi:hypothetical protein
MDDVIEGVHSAADLAAAHLAAAPGAVDVAMLAEIRPDVPAIAANGTPPAAASESPQLVTATLPEAAADPLPVPPVTAAEGAADARPDQPFDAAAVAQANQLVAAMAAFDLDVIAAPMPDEEPTVVILAAEPAPEDPALAA